MFLLVMHLWVDRIDWTSAANSVWDSSMFLLVMHLWVDRIDWTSAANSVWDSSQDI